MPLTSDDRVAIAEVVLRHGHLSDEGALDRLDELFTTDIVYDLQDLRGEPLVGLKALRAALDLGDTNPLAHDVTDTIVSPVDNDTAIAESTAVEVADAGGISSVTYIDVLRREAGRWRISDHKVLTSSRYTADTLRRTSGGAGG